MKDYKLVFDGRRKQLTKKGEKAVQLANSLITKAMYALYPALLVYLAWSQSGILWKYMVIPALFFGLVTAMRKIRNKPRPYETWQIEPFLKKEKKGQSMPSRHVFSATMIAMCFLSLHTSVGLFFLALSALLAVCRVLGGVHYPSDVAAGFSIAVVAGLLFFL
ncbi:phosphatase PAP2 family protein [Streptococcus cameli]